MDGGRRLKMQETSLLAKYGIVEQEERRARPLINAIPFKKAADPSLCSYRHHVLGLEFWNPRCGWRSRGDFT